jgi:hypothetical protein
MGCCLSAAERKTEQAATDMTISGPISWTASHSASAEDRWIEYRGIEIEPPLRSGAIALLDATWLVRLADSGGRLMRRQELPSEAFVSFDELLATGQSADGLRVIAVSQCASSVRTHALPPLFDPAPVT